MSEEWKAAFEGTKFFIGSVLFGVVGTWFFQTLGELIRKIIFS